MRPAHNDAKIANVLFYEATGEGLCVVDLDTVMPGLSLHDFGDLARSTVSDSEEDERDLSRVRVRVPVFEALARGFVEGAGDALSPAERSLLVTGAKVIVYEQAIRFLGDHLDGDRYYRTTRPAHNLDRARNQIWLLESLENAGPELERVAPGPAFLVCPGTACLLWSPFPRKSLLICDKLQVIYTEESVYYLKLVRSKHYMGVFKYGTEGH